MHNLRCCFFIFALPQIEDTQKKKMLKNYKRRTHSSQKHSRWFSFSWSSGRTAYPTSALFRQLKESKKCSQVSFLVIWWSETKLRHKIFQGLSPGSKKPGFPLVASTRDITEEARGEEKGRRWQPSAQCQVHWTLKPRLERSWKGGSDQEQSLCKSTTAGSTERTASHWPTALRASQYEHWGKLLIIKSSFEWRENLRWPH